ncbi:MAG: ribonuclease III [Flavobacteriales bacterium]|nr:ribonuclease III [Flavobacteriales bacterium]
MGITPKDLPLFRQALRHSSAVPDDRPDIPDNERLEFLGDSVLDTVVGRYLFKAYPDKGEGFLTRMRSKLVSRHQLSILAKQVEIERVMEVNIGRNQDTSVPGNAMEALIGALFLDKGFERTNAVVIKLITAHFDLKAVELEDRDSKSRLLEWGQKRRKRVEFVLREDSDHGGRGKLFVAEAHVDGAVRGTGKGHSKKKAEQDAARAANRALGVSEQADATEGNQRTKPEEDRPRRNSRRRGGRNRPPGESPANGQERVSRVQRKPRPN